MTCPYCKNESDEIIGEVYHERTDIYTMSFKCEYCGVIVGNPRHVCKPKVTKISYVCAACGRVGAKKTEVCMPTKI